MDTEAKQRPAMRELIAFHIGEQEFCIEIIKVREIRGFSAATPMPHASSFVVGMINLRGAVLPIIDLAARFGFNAIQTTNRSLIIVVELARQFVGLLVDGVSDIITLKGELLQPTPDIAPEMTRAFLRGVMTFDDRMISMIGVDALVPKSQIAA